MILPEGWLFVERQPLHAAANNSQAPKHGCARQLQLALSLQAWLALQPFIPAQVTHPKSCRCPPAACRPPSCQGKGKRKGRLSNGI